MSSRALSMLKNQIILLYLKDWRHPEKSEKAPRPRTGGPVARPYGVGVGCCLYGQLDGVIGEPRCSRPSDSDGVGACQRRARPGRRF